jgi:hypothetical protein
MKWIGMEWERKRRRGMGWDEVRRGEVKGGEVGGRIGVYIRSCSAVHRMIAHAGDEVRGFS